MTSTSRVLKGLGYSRFVAENLSYRFLNSLTVLANDTSAGSAFQVGTIRFGRKLCLAEFRVN